MRTLSSSVAARRRGGAGVGVGVDLEPGDLAVVERGELLDLVRIGVEEERDRDAGRAELDRRAPRPLEPVALEVEPALGGHLAGALGDQRHLVGLDAHRDRDHLAVARHLQVELAAHALAQPLEVALLDVAAVHAQVRGDARGAGALRDRRRLDRVGVAHAADLAQGGDVVDVDREAERRGGIASRS